MELRNCGFGPSLMAASDFWKSFRHEARGRAREYRSDERLLLRKLVFRERLDFRFFGELEELLFLCGSR